MNELVAAIKLGGITGTTMFAVSNIEGQSISVTVAATCAVFIGGITWWLSSRFQQIADDQNAMKHRLRRIDEALRNCPAQRDAQCAVNRDLL